MDRSMTRLILKIRRYKKIALVGVAAIGVATAALVAVGVFFLLPSKPWQSAGDYVTGASPGISSSVTEMTRSGGGLVEQALFWAATSYVESTLQNVDQQNYASALSCVASLGGPSPGAVIESVKSRVSNPEITQGLDSVLEKIKSSTDAGSKNTSSCLNWFMNS